MIDWSRCDWVIEMSKPISESEWRRLHLNEIPATEEPRCPFCTRALTEKNFDSHLDRCSRPNNH